MRKSSRALALAVVGGVLVGVATGQTPPRIDYRVLAEFSAAPSGPWPHVVEPSGGLGTPVLFSQFPDGGVLWESGASLLWINDAGVQQVLAPGTRIAGLPNGDLRYSHDTGIGRSVIGLENGRAAFRIRYDGSQPGTSGLSYIVGTPLRPETADIRVSDVSYQGLARSSASPFDLVGPFGGVLEPYLSPGMSLGGIAPPGASMRIGSAARWGGFWPEGSIGVSGYAASGEAFSGLVKDGEVRALTFGTTPVPGVTIPISSVGTRIDCVLPDGSVLMTNADSRRGAWIVYPDGTGRDIVTTSTVLPGYPADVRMTQCWPIATADGRIYVLVERVTGGGLPESASALYEFEDNRLQLIVRTGDSRLQGPGGAWIWVMPGVSTPVSGHGNWISSNGRAAWMTNSTALVFAHRSGAVVPAFWLYGESPSALRAFGTVRRFGSSQTSTQFVGIGSDMPSRETRLALDGSLAFWIQMSGGSRAATFVLSARLNLCPPDVNEDGFVDFFDYGAFVDCFESGQGCGRFNVGDFNQDGFTDFFDYAAFVEAFEVGC